MKVRQEAEEDMIVLTCGSVHLSAAKTISILREYLKSQGVTVGDNVFLVGVQAAHENSFRCPRIADGGVTLQVDE